MILLLKLLGSVWFTPAVTKGSHRQNPQFIGVIKAAKATFSLQRAFQEFSKGGCITTAFDGNAIHVWTVDGDR